MDGTARTLSVRADGPAGLLAPAVRETVAQIDPRVPILELATLDQRIPDITRIIRGLARAAAVLGLVALLLASVGLYSVTSYGVAMRRREIAVRMALGARPADVARLILREEMGPVVSGLVVGIGASLVAGFLFRELLFEVRPFDPVVLATATITLALVAALACWIPARRATSSGPSGALRLG